MMRLVPRDDVDRRWTLTVYAIAIFAGLSLTALMLAISGLDVWNSFLALASGAVGSGNALVGSLAKATPLILTGLATVIAYRAQIWSVGQEGQVFSGAMAAYAASLVFTGLPTGLYLAVVIFAGMAGGAALGLVAAVLKNRFAVNEIISTVMLNYLIVLMLSWLLGGGPWTEVSNTVVYQQSPPIADAARLPTFLVADKVHLGLILALLAAILCQILITRTPTGYDIRALGLNPVALAAKGTDVRRTVVLVLVVSGALAGLAGMGEILAPHTACGPTILPALAMPGSSSA